MIDANTLYLRHDELTNEVRDWIEDNPDSETSWAEEFPDEAEELNELNAITTDMGCDWLDIRDNCYLIVESDRFVEAMEQKAQETMNLPDSFPMRYFDGETYASDQASDFNEYEYQGTKYMFYTEW